MDGPYHPLAQLMGRQRVPGTEHRARADRVQEGEHRLLDAALPEEPRRMILDDFIHVVDTLRFLVPVSYTHLTLPTKA